MFFELPRNWLSQKGLRAVVFVKNICQSHRLPAGLWLLVSGISGEAGLDIVIIWSGIGFASHTGKNNSVPALVR